MPCRRGRPVTLTRSARACRQPPREARASWRKEIVRRPGCSQLSATASALAGLLYLGLAIERDAAATGKRRPEGLRSPPRAGCHLPDVLGGQRATGDPPVTARDLLEDHPRHTAHPLTLDRDHRLGQLLDHLALLLCGPDSLDHLHVDERHWSSS